MDDRIGQRLGNYRLVRLLGRGGFAEVYLGEHLRLGTHAAVKILYTRLATPDDVESFEKEARTIAHLKHPHIVRVFDYDVADDTPFLVMDYALHGTLRWRHGKGTRLPLETVVAYVRQVADALQYAHDQRIIHRDVKPENMLIGERDELLLSDFGIALIAQSSRYQRTQNMAGTMAYIAPEQIQGHPRAASDQYSLGIVVYEWLSGDRPFHGSMTEVVAQHLAALAPSLSKKVPTISPDVEHVVMTALAKDPKERFGSVQVFAHALEQAWQSGLPTYVKLISSTPPSSPLPPTVLIPSPSLPPTVAVPQPVHSSPKPGTVLLEYNNHADQVNAITWASDGQRIASAGKDGSIRIWEVSTSTDVSTYQGDFGQVNALAWSLDDRFLASAYRKPVAVVWDTATNSRVVLYQRHTSYVIAITWLPDGSHIATSSDDKTVHVWDVTTGNLVMLYRGQTRKANPLAWSPDAQRIAWAVENNVILVWDGKSKRDICAYRGHKGSIVAAAWSPDGTRVASLSKDETIHVWDASTGRTLCLYKEHLYSPERLAWSPDGKYIASTDHAVAGFQGSIHVWDAAKGLKCLAYKNPSNWVQALAWSPEGTRIASASRVSGSRANTVTIQVWQVM